MIDRYIYTLNGETGHRDRELLRREGEPPTGIDEADCAYDYIGIALNFFRDVFLIDIESIFKGEVHAHVNYGRSRNSAKWKREGLFFGDGDGYALRSYAFSLDIVAHELMHGIINATAGLRRGGDSGSISEHLGDVFGIMVKQWNRRSDVNSARWIVGDTIVLNHNDSERVGIRRLDFPGNAHANDGQVAHVDHRSNQGASEKRMYNNAGILNKAFFEATMLEGGYSWSGVGDLWHQIIYQLNPDSDFQEFSDLLVDIASGTESEEYIDYAFATVGLI